MESEKLSIPTRIWNWFSDIVTAMQMVSGDYGTWSYLRYKNSKRGKSNKQ